MTEKEFQDAASRQLHGPHPFSREALQSPVPAMPLRDYFAGQALAGLASQCDNTGMASWLVPDAAERAYELADAMLAARAKGGGQ